MASRQGTAATPIPAGVARQLCAEIWHANHDKWYTFNGLWCTFCARFSPTSEQRCFANARTPGNRGCAQVNARFDAAGDDWNTETRRDTKHTKH